MPSRARSQTFDRVREGAHVVEMQRRRLLWAFTDILAENGLESATVGRICKRAGVSRRTFYDLFPDREACFLATIDETVERLSQSILDAYSHEDHWYERIRNAFAVLLESLDDDRVLARVLSLETLRAGPAVSMRRQELIDVLTRAVDEGRSESRKGAEPPALAAQSTVGGAISVIHARILEEDTRSLMELLNPLMSMIVHPYLGPIAARRELDRHVPSPKPVRDGRISTRVRDPFRDLPIRITFRTARVLTTIGSQPGASNRQIADASGVGDQGQMSKLLSRLEGFGLIANHGQGQAKGEPNAWQLTQRGTDVLQALNTTRRGVS